MLDLCLIDRCDKVCSVVSSTDGSVDTVDTGTADPSPEGSEMQLCCVQLGSPWGYRLPSKLFCLGGYFSHPMLPSTCPPKSYPL